MPCETRTRYVKMDLVFIQYNPIFKFNFLSMILNVYTLSYKPNYIKTTDYIHSHCTVIPIHEIQGYKYTYLRHIQVRISCMVGAQKQGAQTSGKLLNKTNKTGNKNGMESFANMIPTTEKKCPHIIPAISS